MAKRKSSTPTPKPPIGALGLVLTALVGALVGGWLQDAIGVAYGFYGATIWVTALLLAFMFGLLYYSQYVLSLRGGEGWSEGLALLWRYYWQQAEKYLNSLGRAPVKREPRGVASAVPDPNALAQSFVEVQAGMVKSHHALALSRGGSFQRPAGPGFVMLHGGEYIRQIVDLRPQMRYLPVKATTRDGIPILTTVYVTFRVQQRSLDALEENLPYPYDRDAIFRVSYATSISETEQPRHWTEHLAPKAASWLILELARYTLDELYEAETPVSPIEEIRLRVRQQLEREAVTYGQEVLNVGLDHLNFPPDVVAQRIKTWQSRLERDMQVRRATSDAEAMRRVKTARARAQVKIIESIVQNIEAMRRADAADLSDIVMLRMIEVLEEGMSDQSVQALIPERIIANLVMGASTQMRELLGSSATEGNDADG